MSKGQSLRDLVVARLVAATDEIFELFEKTIAEYEEELSRSKEENRRKQRLLDLVFTPTLQLVRVDAQHVPSPSPGSTRFSDVTQTALTDEESEEHDEEEKSSTHQRGQIEHRKDRPVTQHAPSPSPGTTRFSQEIIHITLTDEESEEHVKEESSAHQQRQSEHRKERQEEEDIRSELECEVQTVNSRDDKNCEPPLSSAGCLETEAGGESVLKTSALENYGVRRLDGDGGAESKTPLRKKRCKKHQCPVCKMKFKYKMDLRVHSRVHQREHSKGKEKPHSGSINPQKRKHEDEKPFVCTLCKKSFRHRSHGNPQKKTHKDEKTIQLHMV